MRYLADCGNKLFGQPSYDRRKGWTLLVKGRVDFPFWILSCLLGSRSISRGIWLSNSRAIILVIHHQWDDFMITPVTQAVFIGDGNGLPNGQATSRHRLKYDVADPRKVEPFVVIVCSKPQPHVEKITLMNGYMYRYTLEDEHGT